MIRKIPAILMLAAVMGMSGCAVKVQDDYGLYLRLNTGQTTFPRISRPFGYSLSPETRQHHTVIRSWMAGIVNSWEVRFNDILQATLNSDDIRNAISLHPEFGEDTDKIHFDLVSYVFTNTRANIQLRITTTLKDKRTLSGVYSGEGPAQTGKMYWGGAFAMKNAVQQSSKIAMDQIFSAYFADLAAAIAQETAPVSN